MAQADISEEDMEHILCADMQKHCESDVDPLSAENWCDIPSKYYVKRGVVNDKQCYDLRFLIKWIDEGPHNRLRLTDPYSRAEITRETLQILGAQYIMAGHDLPQNIHRYFEGDYDEDEQDDQDDEIWEGAQEPDAHDEHDIDWPGQEEIYIPYEPEEPWPEYVEGPDDDLQVFPPREVLDIVFEDNGLFNQELKDLIAPYLTHVDLTQRSNRDEIRRLVESAHGTIDNILHALQECYIFDGITQTVKRNLAREIYDIRNIDHDLRY
jgi:hypothetical protein